MRPPMPSLMLSRRWKIALSVAGILIVLLIAATSLTGVYINWMWFGEVGYRHVYTHIFWTRVILFFVFGSLMALIIGGNLVVAYLVRPPFRPMSQEQQNLERYRVMVEPRKRLVLAAVMVLTLFAAGMSAQGRWQTWLLWLNGGSFGVKDPQFHRDISFFAWDYPAYRVMLGFGFTAVLFALVLSVGVHYLSGAIRLQTPGPKITLAARRHLTMLVFVFVALKAVAYWLDRYGLVFSNRSGFTGAGYTAVHASLQAKTILFWLAVIIAAGVLASMWLRSAMLPGIGFAVLLILSILISGIYPALVQQISVKPNASTKEASYIGRNIAATRQAYGIVTSTGTSDGTVTYSDYSATSAPDAAALTKNDATVSNIRILDPNALSPTFIQQQAQQKNFYGFPAKLDVDRYTVDGETRDYIVGVRELSKDRLAGDQTNWINSHTNFTHGYGFVAAQAAEDVTATGTYADGNIPQGGALNDAVPLTVPQVYYGELVNDYAIVGAKGAPREFDGDGAAKVTYKGAGGIGLSSIVTKLAFAVNYKQTNFLLNDAVSASGAKILINRDPRARVQKAAPFLKIDGDPYPIVDQTTGHIVWMVDGYTTMSNYPYSQRQSLSDLTSDSLTTNNKTAGQPNSQINYIRNSVKATVDSYDGTVRLYAWDDKDPVLKAWMKTFPGLVKNKSAMPAGVVQHIRYPEDMFEVQRSLLEKYHVDDPVTFYNVGDKWTVPSDPYASGDQPPYYVLANPQGGTGTSGKAEFQLTSPMKVNNKTNLASYITVDCDPGPNYGKMTVLKLPPGSVIQGPEQIANSFQSTDVISKDISLFDSGGSKVVHGNLLTLPIGDTFLYVEPLYVQASNNGYPILRRILVAYGDRIGYAASLSNALSDLIPGHQTGQTLTAGSGSNNPGGTSTPTPTPTPTGSGTAGGTSTAPGGATQQQLLTELDNAFNDLQAANKSGDFTAIGAAQAKVLKLLQQYLDKYGPLPSGSATGATPKPTPTK
jgi:uncharacterized protein